jgi:ABC-type dipeptide/oligopeptide/nickel transport system permease component
MNAFWKFFLKRLAAIPVTLLIITLVLYGVVMLMPLESRISLYMPKSNSKIEGWVERINKK